MAALDFVPRTVFAEDAPRDEAKSGETSPGKDAVASAPYRPGSNMGYNSCGDRQMAFGREYPP